MSNIVIITADLSFNSNVIVPNYQNRFFYRTRFTVYILIIFVCSYWFSTVNFYFTTFN